MANSLSTFTGKYSRDLKTGARKFLTITVTTHNKTLGRELIVLKEKRKKEKTQHCVLCQKPAGVHSSLL